MAEILRIGHIPEPTAVAADTLAQLEGATLWITTPGDMMPLRRVVDKACRTDEKSEGEQK